VRVASWSRNFSRSVVFSSTRECVTTDHVGRDLLICSAERSSASFRIGKKLVELRSTGQMRTSVPTWSVVEETQQASCSRFSFKPFRLPRTVTAIDSVLKNSLASSVSCSTVTFSMRSINSSRL
jgi:hypothetical protein